MIYGYARVSSVGQKLYGGGLDEQEDTLRENGAKVIFRESFTGTKYHRPQLDALMEKVQEGDTVVVAKLDRIARSAKDGLQIIDDFLERGAQINIVNMGRFDNSPSGKLMRTILLAFAEFERDMIVQRTQAGRERAKRSNPDYHQGRKPVEYDKRLYETLYAKVERGQMSIAEAARQLGVSRQKWYRIADKRKLAAVSAMAAKVETDG